MSVKRNEVMWLGSESAYDSYEKAIEKVEATPQDKLMEMEAKLFPSKDEDEEASSPILDVTDGVAVINVKGSLTNMNSPFLLFFGMTPYSMIYDAAIEAALDDSVDSILLSVDSGGGTVAGISNALEGLHEAASLKPIYTHTGSNMASAAYWIGSVGTEVMADKMSEVGSIGVIAMIQTYAKAMKKDGIESHVFRAGEYKALGNPYEEMSDKAAKVIQDRIDARYEQFLEAVSEHRGVTVEYVKKNMAEGRVFLAQDAESVGLIDKVASFNDAFRFVKAASSKSDTDRLHGNRGLSAEAADTELPIQSHEGEDMSKKRVVTEEVQAAVAEGADLEATLEVMGAEVDESAEVASEDQGVEEGAEEGAEAEATDEVVEDKAEEEAEEPKAHESVIALVTKVTEQAEELAIAKGSLASVQATADLATAHNDQLMVIAADSITRMSMAMNRSVQDLGSMSCENLLALHQSTRADFNKSLPVGQKVDNGKGDKAVDEVVVDLNNRLASLTK